MFRSVRPNMCSLDLDDLHHMWLYPIWVRSRIKDLSAHKVVDIQKVRVKFFFSTDERLNHVMIRFLPP